MRASTRRVAAVAAARRPEAAAAAELRELILRQNEALRDRLNTGSYEAAVAAAVKSGAATAASASGSARPVAVLVSARVAAGASGVHLALAARGLVPPPRALRWRTFLAAEASTGSS